MIIAIVGKSASGKTTAAAYISEKYGFRHVESDSSLRENLARLGRPVTKMEMSKLGNEWRERFGMDVVTRRSVGDIGGDIVVSGLRSREEWEWLKTRGMSFLVLVEAPDSEREKRGGNVERDGIDESMKGMKWLYERADFVLTNDSTVEEFYSRIDRMMEKILSVRKYDRMGFVCGIEIHQRIDTGKLFCRCSSSQSSEEDGWIERELRFSRGETGGVDEAAAFEHSRRRRFRYYLYRGETCLVEMDEEPPKMPDTDAMSIAAGIASALNCFLLPEIRFMRKIIVDGSNVTGFQRTGIVGMDGWIETSLGKVGIETIAVEEESARPYKDGYRLNSLGIPLVEISTSPDIKSPEHAREVAWKIGLILRSFPVKRGIGSIRQDVNVSIRGGARVEIKGFQYLDEIPDAIEAEIERQLDMVKIAGKLSDSQISDVVELTRFFDGTASKIAKGKRAFGFHISEGAGLFNETVGRVRLGKEVAGYVKPFGLGGIVHTDEDLSKYGLESEFRRIREEMGWNGLVAVAFGGDEAKKAMEFARKKLVSLTMSMEPETRAIGKGKRLHTVFLRPLGSSARMYPETDVPPVTAPEPRKAVLLTDIMEGLEKEVGDYAKQLIRSNYLGTYLEYRDRVDKRFLASLLTSKITELRREGIERPDEGKIRELLDLFIEGKLTKRGVVESLKDDWKKHERIRGKELEELCRQMDFGELMRRYGTRVDPDEARKFYSKSF